MNGFVQKFDMQKGFGFLLDHAGQAYFFHATNFIRANAGESIEKKPKQGESVVFDATYARSVTHRRRVTLLQ